jgi:hypothetical protein
LREFDAFPIYPVAIRVANRTITNRIAASYRDREFYDGDRKNGFGGMANDGRWGPVADNLIKVYSLTDESAVLQIGCHKGFLLAELFDRGVNVRGTEVSDYAISKAPDSVRNFIRKAPFHAIPFGKMEFDLVIAVNNIYCLTLADAIKCLKEIGRVGKGKSFITLMSYETRDEYFLLKKWCVLGSLILKKDEWLEVLNHVGYQGDYRFETVQSLGLVEE